MGKNMPLKPVNSLLVKPVPLGADDATESLSSWIYRLAVTNGFDNYSQLFANEHVKVSGAASLDISPGRWNILKILEHLSLRSVDSLVRHTLQDSLLALSGDSGASNYRWVLSVGANVQKGHGGRYAVCVDCLASDQVPYWRSIWRLSTSTICRKHQRFLLDACPFCAAPFMIWGGRIVGLNRCAVCHKLITTTTFARDSARKVPSGELTTALTVPSAFPIRLSYNHLWWDGLRVLLNVLSRPKLAHKLRDIPCTDSIHSVLRDLAEHARVDFDKQPVRVRHELLNFVNWLTCNWPHRFVQTMNKSGITWTEFSTCEIDIPYWLWSVCKTELDRKRYRVSDGEVQAAAALLASKGSATSKIAIKRLLGVTEGRVLDLSHPKKRRALTDGELVRIARLIDDDLGKAATGRTVQAAMLRDACSISVSMWQQISLRATSSILLSDGQKLIDEWRAASRESGERAELATRFLKWMTLYLGGTRAAFERFNAPQVNLFLSRFGVPTKGFALAGRFADLLRRCDISDWERGAHLLRKQRP